jgi:hypothetical protein
MGVTPSVIILSNLMKPMCIQINPYRKSVRVIDELVELCICCVKDPANRLDERNMFAVPGNIVATTQPGEAPNNRALRRTSEDLVARGVSGSKHASYWMHSRP